MNLARDRIEQSRFFLQKAEEVGFSDRDGFRYFIEASIVAARSVTFLLQKQYHGTNGFDEWYKTVQERLVADYLARFLLEKRNFVLKEGIASIRKVINLTIYETVHVHESVKVKIISGTWKSRLRHLPQDVIYPVREKWAEIKRKYRPLRRNNTEKPSEIFEHYYFEEPEWSTTPAIELLKRQLINLETIVNEAVQQFGEPSGGTSGA